MVSLVARGVTVQVDRKTLVDSVDFSVEPGQVHALIGPNGAGKSTLLAVLAGDRTPSEGTVLLGDVPLADISLDERSRLRSVLTQEHEVAFGFTAREIVELGRRPWIGKSTASEDAQKITWAMLSTDVVEKAMQRVPTLSGGERARVALARILAQDTDVVLLDEPTAALDLGHQEDVLTLVRDLAHNAERPKAVVVVLHDLNLAAAYADTISLLAEGRLAASGTPQEVLTADRISSTYHKDVEIISNPRTGAPIVVPVRG